MSNMYRSEGNYNTQKLSNTQSLSNNSKQGQDPQKHEKKKAAAIKYDPDVSDAPVLKAKGEGWQAEKIIALAKEKNIPIQEDPALVELLSKIELENQIPAELYGVVAEILALVYALEKKAEKHER